MFLGFLLQGNINGILVAPGENSPLSTTMAIFCFLKCPQTRLDQKKCGYEKTCTVTPTELSDASWGKTVEDKRPDTPGMIRIC